MIVLVAKLGIIFDMAKYYSVNLKKIGVYRWMGEDK